MNYVWNCRFYRPSMIRCSWWWNRSCSPIRAGSADPVKRWLIPVRSVLWKWMGRSSFSMKQKLSVTWLYPDWTRTEWSGDKSIQKEKTDFLRLGSRSWKMFFWSISVGFKNIHYICFRLIEIGITNQPETNICSFNSRNSSTYAYFHHRNDGFFKTELRLHKSG